MKFRSVWRGFLRLILEEREVLFGFVATRVLVCAVAWFAFYAFSHGAYQALPSTRPWNLLYHWDALWYGRIVQRGYDFTLGAQSSVTFFPLLPLLIGGLRRLTGAWTPFAGFVISNSALLGSAIVLRRLAQLDFNLTRVGERAVWLLLLAPASFFHSAAYSESLLLLLSLGGILLARRGEWLGSSICAGLASATRPNGVFILIPLLWEAVVASKSASRDARPQERISQSRWWLVVAPAGLLAYMAYLYLRFGDALAFAHSQKAFYREFAWPWEALRIAAGEPPPASALQLAMVPTLIVLSWLCCRVKLRRSYQLYAVALVLLYLCSTTLRPLPRLMSVVFPFYLALASATLRAEGIYFFILALSTSMMVIGLTLFACGYFIT